MKKHIFLFYSAVMLVFFNSFGQKIHVSADFNNSMLPANWTSSIGIGSTNWGFGIDGTSLSGIQNLNGTPLAYMHPTSNGRSGAYLATPSFNNSQDRVTFLEFDYNFNEITTNTPVYLYVDVRQNTSSGWSRVMAINSDDCGDYNGTNCLTNGFPHAKIDISQYKGTNCYVRFYFNVGSSSVGFPVDGFVGIDNLVIHSEPNHDLALKSIENFDGLINCNSDSSELSIEIYNYGKFGLNTTEVYYSINNSPYYVDTIFNTIPSAATFSHKTKQVLPFVNGINTISIYLKHPLDTISENDSLIEFQYTHSSIQNQEQFPYLEDFDSFIASNSPNVIDDTLKNGWSRSIGPQWSYNWRVLGQPSWTSNTGPNSDVTGGNYLYTESSFGSEGDLASVSSPCIQNPSDSVVMLEFWSHRYGDDIETLYIRYFNGLRSIIIDSLVRFQTAETDPWTVHRYKLDVIPNRTSNIEFIGKSDRILQQMNEGDIAIDQIKLYKYSDKDVRPIKLIQPNVKCNLSQSEPITVEIENIGVGFVSSSSLTLNYQVDNGPIVSELIPNFILSNGRTTYTFNQGANLSVPQKEYEIKIFTSHTDDTHYANDTATYKTTNQSLTANYTEGFENVTTPSCQAVTSFGVVDTLLPNNWEDLSGTWTTQDVSLCIFNPAQGSTSSSNTGPSTTYSGNKFLYQEASNTTTIPRILRSNCFDFTNENQITLEFYYHKYGAEMGDLFIEVENVNGIVTTVDSIIGQTQTSSTSLWLNKNISLNAFAGQKIRILFRAVINNSGASPWLGDMAIDSLLVYNPNPVSIEETENQFNKIQLFPNPSKGLFNLEVNQSMIGKGYSIQNTKGQLVQKGIINSAIQIIRLKENTKGLFFLKLNGEGKGYKIVIN